MRINIQNMNGKVFEAQQKDQNTFVFFIGEEEFTISVLKSENGKEFNDLTNGQKKRITDAIVNNKEILHQLEQSELDSEENDIVSFQEYLSFKNEVQDERR